MRLIPDAAGGAFTVQAEPNSNINLTLTGSNGTVTISMTGTGEAQAVSLSEAEVDALGEGTVMVAASQIDEHGNVQEVADAVTSFVIDTIDPSADQVDATGSMSSDTGAEVVVDVDEAGTVTITATFNEPMDQEVLPTFDLDPDSAETLTAQDTGSWADDTTFSITYDVADADFDTDTVSVDVEGAFDVAGNPMTDYTADVEFGIDTRNPEVTGIVSDFDDTNSDNVVSDDDAVVSYTVSFSEPITGMVDGDIAVSGGTLDAGSVVVADDSMSATFSVTASQDSVDDLTVTVNGSVVDVHGNALVPSTSDAEAVDTVNPVAPVLEVTDNDATDADAEGGAFTVTAEDNSSISLTLTGSNYTQASQNLADAPGIVQNAILAKEMAEQAVVDAQAAQGIADQAVIDAQDAATDSSNSSK